jgi:hypothetical protein
MRNFLIAIAVGGNILAGIGAYVIYTRPASEEANYSRSDVLSLSYLSSEVIAINDDENGKTNLNLSLNLILPDTEDISAVCRQSRSISRLVRRAFAKYPVRIKTDKGVDASAVRPHLIEGIRKSLGSSHLVDVDFSLRKDATRIAFHKYKAPVVGCPS